jgi:hypothetical protein
MRITMRWLSDVRDFQLQQFAAAQARAVARHQQRAVAEILRAGNQLTHFVGTQDRGEPPMALRGGSSAFSSRRLSIRTKKKRRAATWSPTVPTASFFSRNRWRDTAAWAPS